MTTTNVEVESKIKGRPKSEHYVKEAEIRIELGKSQSNKIIKLKEISDSWDLKIEKLTTMPEKQAMLLEKEKSISVAETKTYCTNRLVEIIVLTVGRVATLTQFRHYTYLDDMKAEAIYQSVRGFTKFDLSKTNDAGQSLSSFSYLSQIIHNAFKQILKKEKRNRDIKDLAIERMVDDHLDIETDFDSVRRKREKTDGYFY